MVADEVEQTIGVPSEYMMMENDNLITSKELEVNNPANDEKTNNAAQAIISKGESNLASNTRMSRQKNLLSAVDV